jgi:ESS family glutamate:Na+ symporter
MLTSPPQTVLPLATPPFVLMVIVGLGWSLIALVWLAPRFYGKSWFERGIGDFGQSSGSVASGFMLVDMSDPQAVTGARESYSYKQLLYEPFFGGGLITALSILILVRIGLIPALIVSTGLLVLTIAIGIRMRKSAT